jgi:hypothetical protein
MQRSAWCHRYPAPMRAIPVPESSSPAPTMHGFAGGDRGGEAGQWLSLAPNSVPSAWFPPSRQPSPIRAAAADQNLGKQDERVAAGATNILSHSMPEESRRGHGRHFNRMRTPS